ncbi:MAG: MFS transporter [Boseongicola sp.]|nr:MFS transporter [Boseongicola sp.]
MSGTARNVVLYPWFKFLQNLLFWQATWFLFFQSELSAAQAILIYVFYDIATTVLEVPSGYLSDRAGRRVTLIVSAVAGLLAAVMQAFGEGFLIFALAQVALGAHIAFASGTDSALLYESLEAEGRSDEVEAQEVRAWRFTFAGLMVSAVAGGAMAYFGLRIPYVATAIAFAILVVVALRFREPPVQRTMEGGEFGRVTALRAALRNPVLLWLFGLSLLMYGYSHIPFVFGQPFILNALAELGVAGQAPFVSGVVTAIMMGVSILTSWAAPEIRERLGLAGLLLVAFGLQIVIAAGLAATSSALAIGLLFLRMVPNALARPFILARIQPMLQSGMRATYLSIQSLAGRVFFAATLFLASTSASEVGLMPHSDIQTILAAYAGFGLLAFLALAVTARGRGL